MSEYGEKLFEEGGVKSGEEKGKAVGGVPAVLAEGQELSARQISELRKLFKSDLTPENNIRTDVANAYLNEIYQLFPGRSETEVKLALGAWCVVADVGSTQDFGSKHPIVIAGTSVPATAVFGRIVPITSDGVPRKFCSTVFEPIIGMILATHPELNTLLAARSAKAGLAASDPYAVISFLRGNTPATVGASVVRQRAKHLLLATNTRQVNVGGARIESAKAAEVVGGGASVGFESGHNLY